jgi:PIN domain nuclease of toxin-antitoxin system
MLNLDTHILIHAWAGELAKNEKKLLEANEWSISAIVLWELHKLAQLGRITLNLDEPELSAALHRLTIWPLTPAIARISTHLDFSSDPADELIAATSIVHAVPLITRDKKIRRSRQVPFAK